MEDNQELIMQQQIHNEKGSNAHDLQNESEMIIHGS